MLHARNAESMLRFPGDPNAPAKEVINCHCVLIPGVLLPGEEFGEDGEMHTKLLKNEEGNVKMNLDLQRFAESDLRKQSTASIQKGIASFRERIQEHDYKIKHPEEFYPDWGFVSEKIKSGRIAHWKKEISNFQGSIEERIQILKERGDIDE